MGTDVVDADVPDAHLFAQPRAGRRDHRADTPVWWHCRLAVDRLAAGATLDGRPQAYRMAARQRHRHIDGHLDRDLLEPLAAAVDCAVLGVHSVDLFLYRAGLRIAE